MAEIGRQFELELSHLVETNDHIFNYLKDYSCYYMDSGRSAIKYLFESLKVTNILFPNYICESVIRCADENVDVGFYNITKEYEIDMEDLEQQIQRGYRIIFIVNYFGKILSEEKIRRLLAWKERYGLTLIEDTTHSIFTNPCTVGDYCVCSLRKWFPVSDGGVLYAKTGMPFPNGKNMSRQTDVSKIYYMIMKTLYLKGKLADDAVIGQAFAESEDRLDGQDAYYQISVCSEEILRCLDVKEVIQKRVHNCRHLYKNLKSEKIHFDKEVDERMVPFMFVITCDHRDRLRAYLSKNGIYCPVHWPIEESLYRGNTEKVKKALEMNKRILSIPIDQRYDEKDMDRIVKVIEEYERATT